MEVRNGGVEISIKVFHQKAGLHILTSVEGKEIISGLGSVG